MANVDRMKNYGELRIFCVLDAVFEAITFKTGSPPKVKY